MKTIHATVALTHSGWNAGVRIGIEEETIASLDFDQEPSASDERHAIVLAGMPNVHSHAFQRGMAGLAEVRGRSADDFWSWRETMYRFALSMTPDHMEAVAAQAYVEMLEAGFTRVGEFHYLHHDRDGRPFGNIAEMSERIAAAASGTGIELTLLPAFYAHSTFGGVEPAERQRRFVNDIDAYARLLEGCRAATKNLSGAALGVAPHSLRAVTPVELSAVVRLAPEGPIHIHAAEQLREVEDCLAWSGARPVEWLLANAELDARWCLIHATHMTEAETFQLAGSGALVGLCPVTEANLGDGTFAAPLFAEKGGRFAIGSDSNVLIGVADELRQLEYSQRLLHRARNVMALPEGSTGRRLFEGALAGGLAATAAPAARLIAGGAANLVSLFADHPSLAARSGDAILDAWIFAGRDLVDCVWVRGEKCVESGRHRNREAVARRFRSVMEELQAA